MLVHRYNGRVVLLLDRVLEEHRKASPDCPIGGLVIGTATEHDERRIKLELLVEADPE